ncbi:hypothetical protein CVT25_010191 [Psilocybe cyanescens]|uniref:Uncharacterized protein n=1 Tax=Psilocybe cyanescens TaxID=93625 RepID=A0A409XCY2_PSICY|nr:hypothetical protein CVT25_010191 [Psilocybe cyanescens]
MKSSKSREYCCCAIPMVNAGIYATLIEQTVLGIVVGTVSISTPSIVGASTPSFAAWILAIVCYIAAGVQLLGFLGEKPTVYRRYVTLHGLAITAAFSVAAAWVIMSATRHSTAKAKCITDFFPITNGQVDVSSEGDTLCNIFPWVDVGIMGGLLVFLAAVHIYFFVVLSSYGTSQRRDHDRYDQVYDPTQPLTSAENIPLGEQNDPWDTRGSAEYNYGRQDKNYTHIRNQSSVSASDVLREEYREPKDGFSEVNYGYSAYPQKQEPAYPSNAYTQENIPTPTNNYYDAPNDHYVERPMQAQPHPAEGSFKRKTPRLPNL